MIKQLKSTVIDIVIRKSVIVGVLKDMVIQMGDSKKKNKQKTITENKTMKQWVHGSSYRYFELEYFPQ